METIFDYIAAGILVLMIPAAFLVPIINQARENRRIQRQKMQADSQKKATVLIAPPVKIEQPKPESPTPEHATDHRAQPQPTAEPHRSMPPRRFNPEVDWAHMDFSAPNPATVVHSWGPSRRLERRRRLSEGIPFPEDEIQKGLARLNLTNRYRNSILRTLDSCDLVFADIFEENGVLLSFNDWCDKVIDGELDEILLSTRNFGPKALAALKQAIQEYRGGVKEAEST